MLVKDYKQDFPFLIHARQTDGRVYLDNAATTQKPRVVLDELLKFYETSNANVHRGVGSISCQATEWYEAARKQVADFINAPAASNIVFTRSATESLNWIAFGYAVPELQTGDEILISIAEHHSNLVPWQQVAQRTGATLIYVDVTPNGQIDLEDFRAKISPKTKIVSVQQVSNVLGNVNPIKKIGALTHRFHATLIVDGAQSVPHLPVDVQDLDADFFVFSGHKVYGPTGIGVLYGKPDRLARMQPTQFGGEMIDYVHREGAAFQPAPLKFEAGTPNVAGAIGLKAALSYLQKQGLDQLLARERDLMNRALTGLNRITGVEIYGSAHPEEHFGVIAFNLHGIHPHDAATGFDLEGIELRAGHHCAEPLMDDLGVTATLRMSLAFYNDNADIDRFLTAVQHVKEFFANGTSEAE